MSDCRTQGLISVQEVKEMAKPDRKFPVTRESDALVRRILRETAKGTDTAAVRDALVRRIDKTPPPKQPK